MDGPMSKFRLMNMNRMPVGAELEKIESDALHLLNDTIQGISGKTLESFKAVGMPQRRHAQPDAAEFGQALQRLIHERVIFTPAEQASLFQHDQAAANSEQVQIFDAVAASLSNPARVEKFFLSILLEGAVRLLCSTPSLRWRAARAW